MDTRALAGTKIYNDHLYEFNVLSFGIGNSSQAFQRFIDEVVHGLLFVFANIDDILIASSSPKEHQQHIQEIFKRLDYFGLKAFSMSP